MALFLTRWPSSGSRCLATSRAVVGLRPELGVGARWASKAPGASSVLSQLRGGPDGEKTPEAAARVLAAPRTGRTQLVGADRGFIAAGGQVLIHDHRELKFLKQVTAAGITGALMSSSGLAYAVALDFGFTYCGSLVLQTTGAAVLLLAYLRSYVARATLDPRRARVVITGCNLFGEPLAQPQELPLAIIEPGADVGDHYIKFRIKGSMFNPACWIAYRIPRAAVDGSDRKPGAQVGHTAMAARQAIQAASESSAAAAASVAAAQRSFKGAGLGASDDGKDPSKDLPRGFAPQTRSRGSPGSQSRKDDKAEWATPQKSLAGLQLHHGLPLNHAEEQKIIEFLKEPTAYAAAGLRLE